jgi:hypothetical protein
MEISYRGDSMSETYLAIALSSIRLGGVAVVRTDIVSAAEVPLLVPARGRRLALPHGDLVVLIGGISAHSASSEP